MYNYFDAMKADVMDYINNKASEDDYMNVSEYKDSLYEELWNEDSVTGNASGTYFCNSYKAMNAVLDNLDILRDAIHEFGETTSDVGEAFLNEDWESLDVTIRCYVLNQVIDSCINELESEFWEACNYEDIY